MKCEKQPQKCRTMAILKCKYCQSMFCAKCIQIDIHQCRCTHEKILESKKLLEINLPKCVPIRHGIDDTWI